MDSYLEWEYAFQDNRVKIFCFSKRFSISSNALFKIDAFNLTFGKRIIARSRKSSARDISTME